MTNHKILIKAIWFVNSVNNETIIVKSQDRNNLKDVWNYFWINLVSIMVLLSTEIIKRWFWSVKSFKYSSICPRYPDGPIKLSICPICQTWTGDLDRPIMDWCEKWCNKCSTKWLLPRSNCPAIFTRHLAAVRHQRLCILERHNHKRAVSDLKVHNSE